MQRELCYKNYNQNMTPPEWNIEQERYWQGTDGRMDRQIFSPDSGISSHSLGLLYPEWDIEEERYWQVSTVNSTLEYIVYLRLINLKGTVCFFGGSKKRMKFRKKKTCWAHFWLWSSIDSSLFDCYCYCFCFLQIMLWCKIVFDLMSCHLAETLRIYF
jgi:hypothetical protein